MTRGSADRHFFVGSEKVNSAKRRKTGGSHHKGDKRRKPPQLLTDDELAAQADFIRECRRPHPHPTERQIAKQVQAEQYSTDYPAELERLQPDELKERKRIWRNGS